MQWAARRHFESRSSTLRLCGAGLLAVAAGLLIWVGCLLLVPYTVNYGRGTLECESPVASSSFQNDRSLCGQERDWPELMLLLALSVPTAVAGTALCVSGAMRNQISTHVFAVIEMQKSEERLRSKQDKRDE